MEPLAYAVLSLAAIGAALTAVYVHWILPERCERRLRNSMRAFAKAVELRFPMQAGFAEQVAELAVAIGREMALDEQGLGDLETAARLSQIGLCAMPYSLNEKEMTRWSEAELRMFFEYPRVSGAMLELVPSLRHLAPLVRQTRDLRRRGISRESASLGTRILEVATDFVWLERRYGLHLAMDEVRRRSGRELCPEVTERLDRVLNSLGAREREPEASR